MATFSYIFQQNAVETAYLNTEVNGEWCNKSKLGDIKNRGHGYFFEDVVL
jgi:hypothetical protein